jgi:F-type H+-transporting ATPase subunit b
LLQRKEKISGLEGEIDRFQKEALEKADAFSSGMKDARVKGLNEKNALVRTAAEEEKEIIAKINEKAAAELANVRDKIAKDAENVRKALLKDVDVFASEISKKNFGEGYIGMRIGKLNHAKIFQSSVIIVVMAAMMLCFSGAAFGSGGGHEEGGKTKTWEATDTYRVMNFFVLAVVLFFLLRKPASQALNARIQGIREQLSELEAKKKSAEKELSAYSQKLLLLDQETEKIVEDYIKQGKEAKVKILREAESAAEKLEEQAQRNIEQEFKRAKLQLQEDILENAIAKAEKMIAGQITTDDQDRLVDEYLKKVVA